MFTPTRSRCLSIGIGARCRAGETAIHPGQYRHASNPLDLAINGAGFFRMTSNGTVTFERNGQFSLDKNGFIVNNNSAISPATRR